MRSFGFLPAPEMPDLASIRSRRQDASLRQRLEREQRSRRVAAWVGNELSAAHRCAVPLRQPVDRLECSQLGCRIPAFSSRLIPQPEGAGQVNDAHALLYELGARPAAASSGNARKTTSLSLASLAAENGSIVPSQIIASAGNTRGGPSGEDDMAAVTRAFGWPAISRRTARTQSRSLPPPRPDD